MSVNGPLGATPQTGSVELGAAVRARPETHLGKLGIAGLVGIVLTVLLICISAAATHTLLPEYLDSSLAGPFNNIGLYLPSGVLLGVLSLMFASYVVVVRSAERLTPAMVLAAIAAVYALVLIAPPLFSTDIFSYQAYAREWITYGANPYTAGPLHVLALGTTFQDPLSPYIGAKWISTPTVYGPVFTALSAFLASASIAASVLAFKAVAALSALITVVLLWNGARLRGLDPVRSVALFALNPLVVVYGVGGGHNDLLMLVAVTAGVYALLAHRERTSGAMIMLGAAVKLTGLLLLPFALASGVELGAGKRRRSILVGAAIVSIGVAALGFSLFGVGLLNLLPTLRQVQSEGDWHSIPGFITSAFGLGGVGMAAGIVLGLAFLGVFAWLLRRVWHGEMDWIDGAGWATLAMLVTASSVLPWYVAWLLPLVALGSDRRLWRWSLIISGIMLGTTMLGYIPHGSHFLGIPVVP